MDKKNFTYYVELEQCGNFLGGNIPDMLSYALKSLAYHGVRHVVLSESLLALMMQYQGLSYKIKDAVEAAGLDFVDAHSIFGTWWDLNEPDDSRRAEMVATHIHAMALAASMGIKTITIHVGNSLSPNVNYKPSPWLEAISRTSREQMIENSIKALKVLVPYAEGLGMTICIENVRYICTTPEALLEIKRNFPSEALGFCYDAGHANIVQPLYEASDIPEQRAMAANKNTPLALQILKQMLPHIVNCHLHDNDGTGDQHRLPGDGTLDWNAISDLLRQAPRLQCLQSEVLQLRNGIPLPALTRTFQNIFGKWAE
ncbi:MAG: sugar phosphate isomerase/epimerase [Victivallales bacterium]|nr:sugar phosphate isomerase/epimerase [Victivallales bacterium]